MDQNYVFGGQNGGFEPINFGNMPQQDNGSKGYATASLVLGILSMVFICILCCFYYAALPCAILSIVFAFVAKKKNGGTMPGKAVAGLILAIIGILLFIVCIAFEIWFTATLGGMTDEEILAWLEEHLGYGPESFPTE